MKVHKTGGWFVKYHQARQKVTRIREHLAAGGAVMVLTYTKATVYGSKHVGWFEARPSGAFVRSGKQMLCIDGAAVRFGKEKK